MARHTTCSKAWLIAGLLAALLFCLELQPLNAAYDPTATPPVGAIMPWAKSLTGVPNLPDGWAECDGSTVSDARSPLDGTTLPDLNGGTYRMLRGASTSGGTGGADTTTLTTSELPAHSHGVTDPGHAHGTDLIRIPTGAPTIAAGAPPELEAKATDSATTGISIDSAGSGASFTNLPAYYNVVWIIRVR